MIVYAAEGESPFDGVLVSLTWRSPITISSGQFTTQYDPWEAMVCQPGYMTSPTQLFPSQHCLNAGDFGSFKDIHVCGEITPVNVEDGAEATLMKTLEETFMAEVSSPRL